MSNYQYLIKNYPLEKKNGKILIMLHGYGSNYNDLISLSDFFGDDYLYISIQANHSLDPNSYCWWSLHFDSDHTLKSDFDQAKYSVENLNKFIQKEIITKYNINTKNIILLGFSQGAMLAYALSLNFYDIYKKVIGLSGKIQEEIIKPASYDKYKDHKFYCSHGIFDQTIPITYARKASDWFEKNKIDHQFQEFDSQHNLCMENIEAVKNWLKIN